MTRSFNRIIALAIALLLAGCAVPRPETSRPSPRPAPAGPASDTPVKIGRPYQVGGVWYYPADDPGYDEVGYASWYGPQFHGGRTANGEVFDMDRIGAAHKTLPLPSYVEVTALDTGRTILVRVNDRGPFVTSRIIDLSRRAAQLLGTERKGVARVRVRRVYPSEADKLALRWGRPASERPYATGTELAMLNQRFANRSPGPAAPPRVAAVVPAAPAVVPVAPAVVPAVPATPAVATVPVVPAVAVPVGGFFVQVAAVGNRARAEEIAEMVAGRIEPAGTLWRVRMGPYKSETDATSALAQVRADGYQEARLVVIASGSKPAEGIIPQ